MIESSVNAPEGRSLTPPQPIERRAIAPRTAEDNDYVRQQRLEQILDAARRVFARKGLAGTKISDIAREANISHGLVYHYFDGKDDIFLTLVERSLQGALAVTNAAKERPGTPWERIEWLFNAMVFGGRSSPDYLIIAIQASTSDAVPADTGALMERYGEPLFRNVVELIQDGQQSGAVTDGDPRKLASALLASVQGLALATVTGSNDPEILPGPELILRMFKTDGPDR